MSSCVDELSGSEMGSPREPATHDLEVRVKKSSKSVVQTQWKSKTVSSKRSGTIMFKDHVRVLGVKKGTVSMKAFTVPLQKAPKLNLKVMVSSPKKETSGKKVPKSGIFKGVKVFTAWSSIRCFAATTRASASLSGRGICDLANQIRWSLEYRQVCEKFDMQPGTYLTVEAAEWFSGLPRHWTSLSWHPDMDTFDQMFPNARKKAGKLPVISLFSGCGGLELGLSNYLWATGYVEINHFAREVLKKRMDEGFLHKADIHDDIRTLKVSNETEAEGCGGGFPCQGISCGGSQGGLDDPRSSLLRKVFETFDKIPADKRKLIYLEHVKSILSKASAMQTVMKFLIKACADRGLELSWSCAALENVGLPAQRRRVFFFAVAAGFKLFQDRPLQPLSSFFPGEVQ